MTDPDSRHDGSLRAESDISFDQLDRLTLEGGG
jgi:hypothetical protein